MEQITVTMSETALEKIKIAQAIFELVSNLDDESNCIDSIQLLCNRGFVNLGSVLAEIRGNAGFAEV